MTRALTFLSLVLATVACTQRARPVAVAEETPPTVVVTQAGAARAISIVELFTSEGCSSCPPVDVIVNALPAREAERDVIVVAWHVDYWDSLGWPDPFATRENTERQRAYASALQQSGVYTPEVVLDGAESGRTNLADAISHQTTAAAPMELSILSVTSSSLNVKYAAKGVPADARVVFVVVESGLVRTPDRGENRGRTLRHDHVARATKTTSPPSGEVTIELATTIDRSRSELIAFVEQPATMRKLAAARVPLR